MNSGLRGGPINSLAIDLWTSAVYAGGQLGVTRSTDYGQGWTALNNGIINTPSTEGRNTSTLHGVAIDLWVPSTLYAATSDRRVLRTRDSGASWTVVNEGLPTEGAQALAVDPSRPGTIFVGASSGLYKSTDAGAHWEGTGLTEGAVPLIAISPSDPDVLYVLRETSHFCHVHPFTCTSRGISRSTDGGSTWIHMPPPAFVSIMAVHPAAATTLYAGATNVVYRSTDGGATWMGFFEGLPNTPIQALAIDRWTPTLYAGTRAGVYKSTDGGMHWSPLNAGLSDLWVNALAIDPWYPNVVYAGTNSGVFVLYQ